MRHHIHSEPEITLTPQLGGESPGYRGAEAAAAAAQRRSRERGRIRSALEAVEHSQRGVGRFVFSVVNIAMTNSLDMRAQQLVTVAGAVDALREQLDAAAAVRDTLIRDMRREGYSAIELASLLGMNRARVYQIMVEPLPEDDDTTYAEIAERIEDAWQEACQLWAESDGSGTPDDFFPLERLLARR